MKKLLIPTKFSTLFFPFSFFLFPYNALAASCPNPNNPSAPGSGNAPKDLGEFVCLLLNFINTALPILVGATLVVFFWGLVKFIYAAGDEKKIADGKQLILWGIIGLFVMVSIWGIINLFYADVIGGNIQLPILPTGNTPGAN